MEGITMKRFLFTERPNYDLRDCSREFLEKIEKNIAADVAAGRKDLQARLDLVRSQIPRACPYHILYSKF